MVLKNKEKKSAKNILQSSSKHLSPLYECVYCIDSTLYYYAHSIAKGNKKQNALTLFLL